MNFSFAAAEYDSLPAIAGLVLLLVGLVVGCVSAWKIRPAGYLLLLWLVFPFAVVLILMNLSPVSLYVDRYFLVVAPPLLLLISAGLLSLQPAWLRRSALILLVALTGWGLWRVYFDTDNFSKEDWRALARILDERVGLDDVVITCTDGHRLSLEYYNPHQYLSPERVLFAGQVTKMAPATTSAWVVAVQPRLAMHHLAKTVPPNLDLAQLSPPVAGWQVEHLRNQVAVAGINAYRYELGDSDFLPEIVAWHCQN
jgi:hypothetical protein